MKLIDEGETGTVKGKLLIADDPNCGKAVVTNFQKAYVNPKGDQSHYVVAYEQTFMTSNFGGYYLSSGMYCSVYGPIKLTGGSGVCIQRPEYKCLNTIGGPVEETGRLRYIDGCTDTLLIGPPVIGDPCLNLLHFPRNIRQTMHTHPSLRAGIVLSGVGRAIHPGGELPLTPGCCWFLDTNGEHCFYTDDSELTVCAWHPDSDTGPTHDNHPMLNKTIVDGVSSRYIDTIRTKKLSRKGG